jgi:hypothetical protein
MGVHRHPPKIYFLFGASSVDAPAGHPSTPPLPSYPSTMDALVYHPQLFPFAPSIEVVIVDVASEKLVQLSTPPTNESPSMPDIFTVR